MTGKENIKRAIEFRQPEYLPLELYFFPSHLNEKDEKKVEEIQKLAESLKYDIIDPSTYIHAIGETTKEGDLYYFFDEWQTGWVYDGFSSKAISFPLQGGYDLLADYKFPDPKLGPHVYLKDVLEKHDGTKYVRAYVWFTLFERLWMLRGFENMLLDPYTNTEDFEKLRDRIVEFNISRIEQWLDLGVDGIYLSDDWGTQRGLLMNPDDWRKYYKPAYKKMFRKIRDGGAHVWMHLCGDITLILPDLIEIGLNVLNPIQPQAMDVDKLAKEFGGKVCFNGGVDVQGTLVNGSPEDVKNEVYKLVEIFGKYQGGYIGSTSHSIMPETPLDNVKAMFEAFADIQGK